MSAGRVPAEPDAAWVGSAELRDGTRLELRPLDEGTWDHLVELFTGRGQQHFCWCMFFRLTNREFSPGWGDGNREALRALVAAGGQPGLVAYAGGRPVGWVSAGPREDFGRVGRAPTIRPVQAGPDELVWSVVCFYIPPAWRGRGLGAALLDGAARWAATAGATAVECYPVDPERRTVTSADAYPGLVAWCQATGFTEVTRRGTDNPRGRPIMRRQLV
jgi:GNAT superfamily N-acetyltransferase